MRRKNVITKHALALAVLLTGLLVPVLSSANDVRQVDDLLSAWQMEEAKQEIEKMKEEYAGTPDVLYLQARYDFFQGDYEKAVSRLDQALNLSDRRDWEQLRHVVTSTHQVTKDYERHLSPKGYFAVYVEPGKDEVLLPYAFEALENAYEEIGAELGYRPPTPIRVEVYPRTSTLADVSILTEDEIRTSGTIALCKYNRLMITSPKALLRGYGWVDTLVHEYVHYVINRKTKNRVPIWMHEGLAKFLERRWRGPDEHRLNPSSEHLLQKRVKQRNLITFAQMHPSMAKLPSQEDAAVAFAEVYTAMEYLRKKAGPTAFQQLLDAISEGKDAQDAFASVLGVSFKEFERDWKQALQRREDIDFPEESGFEENLIFKDERTTELDQIPQPKARDHMHLGEMLQARERFAAAVVEYRKAIRLLGNKHPVLQTRLAQSLIAQGEPEKALEALKPVQATYPGYVATWLQLGKAANAVGNHQKAVEYLREAARINPFDPEIHDVLADSLESLGKKDLADEARRFAKLVS